MKPTGGLNRARRVLGRLWRAVRESRGLINTTDLMVASGATIILAAGVAAVATDGVDQAKYGKAQPDAVSLATAMQKFFADTGKWPGQVEILASTNFIKRFLATGAADTPTLPSGVASKFDHLAGALPCGGNSLEGAIGKTFGSLSTSAAQSFLDINDFLVKKPKESDYPNWKGPYLPADIRSDPWDKVWVINVVPLFCAEEIEASTTSGTVVSTGGKLGYAWILSGGANREFTTDITDAKLDKDGDDAGVNLGKLIQQAKGGRNN